MGRASRRGSLRLEREPCCTGLAERMKLGWELGRPFPRRACSESNRGQQGSKPCGRIRRHKRRDARSGKRVGLEPGSRTQRSRYRNRSPLPAGARGGLSARSRTESDRDRNPERGSATTERRCARPESNRAIGLRRPTPGSARTSAKGDADASRTRPRGFAIRAHRWVSASRSGQRVTLPQCLSGTQASSLSDWPRQSGRRESNTLHRVGGPRSDHQTAPASGAPRRYRAGPTSLQRTAGPWPEEQRAACRSRTGAWRLTEARCHPGDAAKVESPRVALGLRRCERRR